MALLPLLLFLTLPQARELAPGDPDRGLDPELRAALEAIDPRAAGWESEAEAAGFQRALAELVHAIRGEADLEDVVTADCPAPVLLPAVDAAPLFADAHLRIVRAEGRARAEDGGRGPAAVAAALAALGAGWRGTPDVHLKLVGIAGDGDRRHTRVLAHLLGAAAGEAAGARRELSGAWNLRWRREGEVWRLEELAPETLTRVDGGGPLLADRTGALFGADPAFRDTLGEERLGFGWGEGIGGLRARLDTRLGLPILGSLAGVAVGDVDGDGLEDLYLAQPGGLPNRLLLHRPDHGLRDASLGSGADFLEASRGALLVDLDGDGDLDLAVTVLDELLLLGNDGAGRFSVGAALRVSELTSLAAADADLDGDLDLYACAYSSPYGAEALPIPYHDARNGLPNVFLENRTEPGGPLAFVDATAARGLDHNNDRFSFAASWEDADGDGDPDLYVANDFGRNNLYRNDGGRFRDVAAEAGVEDVSAGMGVSWGDADGDGRFDLYVSNMYSAAGNRVAYQRRFQPGADDLLRAAYRRHARGNSLFLNAGDGRFVDASEASGTTMARWAWGARFVDLNNDGRLDLLAPNGFLTGERADDL